MCMVIYFLGTVIYSLRTVLFQLVTFLFVYFTHYVCWYDVETVVCSMRREEFSCWLLVLSGWLQQGAKLFLKLHRRAKGNKPSCNIVHFTYALEFFSHDGGQHQKRFSWEAVESLALEMFKRNKYFKSYLNCVITCHLKWHNSCTFGSMGNFFLGVHSTR